MLRQIPARSAEGTSLENPPQGGGTLVVQEKPPINRLSGNDLRLWHLLDGGQADVLCFRWRTHDDLGREIVDPLPWQSFNQVSVEQRDWAQTVNRVVAEHGYRHLIINVYSDLRRVEWMRDIACRFNANFPDSISLLHRRKFQAASLGNPVEVAAAFLRYRLWVRAEARIARMAASCIVTGAADREAFAGGRASCIAVGNGTTWTASPPVYQVRAPANVLAIHGNMNWPPNVSGIEFMGREVLPLVRREIPDIELRVAGGPLDARVRALVGMPGIRMFDYVEDLRGFLAGCDLYVAPMVEGSGVKNKLLEAMAAGMPVVTNPMGAEGLDEEGRRLVAIGDDAPALAAHIVALLRSPDRRARMSDAIREHATANYGWSAVARRYRESLVPVSGEATA